MDAWVPLVVAASGLPAVGLSAWLARSPSALMRGIALRTALTGIAILLGALGLYWFGGDPVHGRTVGIVLLVVVNVLALSMALFVIRMRREGARR